MTNNKEENSGLAIALAQWAVYIIQDMIMFCIVSWLFRDAWNGVIPFLSHNRLSVITFGHSAQVILMVWGLGRMFGVGLASATAEENYRALKRNSRPAE